MAEYIEREAVLKVLRGKAVAKYPSTYYMGLFAAANEVGEIPAADVVERSSFDAVAEKYAKYQSMDLDGTMVRVVRCKDCRYGRDLGLGLIGCVVNNSYRTPYNPEDHFCSYGELRDSDAGNLA